MKKTFASVILTAVATLAFAEEPVQPYSAPLIVPIEKLPVGEKDFSNGTLYLRMGIADTYPAENPHVIPGLGLGYRINAGAGALDFSANYTQGTGLKGEQKRTFFYTLPKVAYLHYLTPSGAQSLYAGGGLAFGGLKNKEDTRFTGLIPNATLGYEMSRKSPLRTFIQLDVSQPAVAATLDRAAGA